MCMLLQICFQPNCFYMFLELLRTAPKLSDLKNLPKGALDGFQTTAKHS